MSEYQTSITTPIVGLTETVIAITFLIVILLVFIAVLLYILLSGGDDSNIPESQRTLNWVNSLVYVAGFEYNNDQGIYQTRRDAIQRLAGFNDFYDQTTTAIFMVIDLEPILFQYQGINYMIELWKGQYYASTGCEIGVYIESKGRPGRYYCAPDEDMLQMSYVLMGPTGPNGQMQEIFRRSGIHWWLTGFKPGVFNDPVNLSMENINIQFKNNDMAAAFYKGLESHFQDQQTYDYKISGKNVTFRWKQTKFPQPTLDLRKMALDYNKQLTAGVVRLMGPNGFSPAPINKKVLEGMKFLLTDDHVDDIIDWMIQDKYGPQIKQYTALYDAKNGTNIIEIINILQFLKDYGGKYWIPFVTSMKTLCADPLKVFKGQIPSFCKFFS